MAVQLLTQNQNKLANKFLLTTQQYHLMHEAGVFQEGDRIELVYMITLSHNQILPSWNFVMIFMKRDCQYQRIFLEWTVLIYRTH